MEKKERNNFFAVPLIGGILCINALFGYNLFLIPSLLPGNVSFNPPGFYFIVLIIGLVPIVLNLVVGILMIVSAVKLKNGKRTLFKEKKKLLSYSWVVVSVSLGLSIFSIFIYGSFFILHEYALIGGLIIILGNFFYKRVNQRNSIYGPPLVQEREETETRSMKEQSTLIVRVICTNCGFKSKEESLKFCPECGSKFVSKKKI